MWRTQDFLTRFDEWTGRELPSDDERVAVMAWIHSLQSSPHRGADRRLDLGIDWWFTEIAATNDGRTVTTCLYRIDEVAMTVRCSVIATLTLPLD
jgi:hypothetical protein